MSDDLEDWERDRVTDDRKFYENGVVLTPWGMTLQHNKRAALGQLHFNQVERAGAILKRGASQKEDVLDKQQEVDSLHKNGLDWQRDCRKMPRFQCTHINLNSTKHRTGLWKLGRPSPYSVRVQTH